MATISSMMALVIASLSLAVAIVALYFSRLRYGLLEIEPGPFLSPTTELGQVVCPLAVTNTGARVRIVTHAELVFTYRGRALALRSLGEADIRQLELSPDEPSKWSRTLLPVPVGPLSSLRLVPFFDFSDLRGEVEDREILDVVNLILYEGGEFETAVFSPAVLPRQRARYPSARYRPTGKERRVGTASLVVLGVERVNGD